jgi:hypothetical protein
MEYALALDPHHADANPLRISQSDDSKRIILSY